MTALLALLDVPVDEASWHALDPLQRRQQTLDAVKRLLLRESKHALTYEVAYGGLLNRG